MEYKYLNADKNQAYNLTQEHIPQEGGCNAIYDNDKKIAYVENQNGNICIRFFAKNKINFSANIECQHFEIEAKDTTITFKGEAYCKSMRVVASSFYSYQKINCDVLVCQIGKKLKLDGESVCVRKHLAISAENYQQSAPLQFLGEAEALTSIKVKKKVSLKAEFYIKNLLIKAQKIVAKNSGSFVQSSLLAEEGVLFIGKCKLTSVNISAPYINVDLKNSAYCSFSTSRIYINSQNEISNSEIKAKFLKITGKGRYLNSHLIFDALEHEGENSIKNSVCLSHGEQKMTHLIYGQLTLMNSSFITSQDINLKKDSALLVTGSQGLLQLANMLCEGFFSAVDSPIIASLWTQIGGKIKLLETLIKAKKRFATQNTEFEIFLSGVNSEQIAIKGNLDAFGSSFKSLNNFILLSESSVRGGYSTFEIGNKATLLSDIDIKGSSLSVGSDIDVHKILELTSGPDLTPNSFCNVPEPKLNANGNVNVLSGAKLKADCPIFVKGIKTERNTTSIFIGNRIEGKQFSFMGEVVLRNANHQKDEKNTINKVGAQSDNDQNASNQNANQEKLKENNLSYWYLQAITMPGDGHCFFRAIGCYLGKPQLAIRNMLADYIQEHASEFSPHYELGENEHQKDYINNLRVNRWATHVEVEALMRLLKRPVIILRHDNKKVSADSEARFKGEPIFLLFDSELKHYDLLFPIENVVKNNSVAHKNHEEKKFTEDEVVQRLKLVEDAKQKLTTTISKNNNTDAKDAQAVPPVFIGNESFVTNDCAITGTSLLVCSPKIVLGQGIAKLKSMELEGDELINHTLLSVEDRATVHFNYQASNYADVETGKFNLTVPLWQNKAFILATDNYTSQTLIEEAGIISAKSSSQKTLIPLGLNIFLPILPTRSEIFNRKQFLSCLGVIGQQFLPKHISGAYNIATAIWNLGTDVFTLVKDSSTKQNHELLSTFWRATGVFHNALNLYNLAYDFRNKKGEDNKKTDEELFKEDIQKARLKLQAMPSNLQNWAIDFLKPWDKEYLIKHNKLIPGELPPILSYPERCTWDYAKVVASNLQNNFNGFLYTAIPENLEGAKTYCSAKLDAFYDWRRNVNYPNLADASRLVNAGFNYGRRVLQDFECYYIQYGLPIANTILPQQYDESIISSGGLLFSVNHTSRNLIHNNNGLDFALLRKIETSFMQNSGMTGASQYVVTGKKLNNRGVLFSLHNTAFSTKEWRNFSSSYTLVNNGLATGDIFTEEGYLSAGEMKFKFKNSIMLNTTALLSLEDNTLFQANTVTDNSHLHTSGKNTVEATNFNHAGEATGNTYFVETDDAALQGSIQVESRTLHVKNMSENDALYLMNGTGILGKNYVGTKFNGIGADHDFTVNQDTITKGYGTGLGVKGKRVTITTALSSPFDFIFETTNNDLSLLFDINGQNLSFKAGGNIVNHANLSARKNIVFDAAAAFTTCKGSSLTADTVRARGASIDFQAGASLNVQKMFVHARSGNVDVACPISPDEYLQIIMDNKQAELRVVADPNMKINFLPLSSDKYVQKKNLLPGNLYFYNKKGQWKYIFLDNDGKPQKGFVKDLYDDKKDGKSVCARFDRVGQKEVSAFVRSLTSIRDRVAKKYNFANGQIMGGTGENNDLGLYMDVGPILATGPSGISSKGPSYWKTPDAVFNPILFPYKERKRKKGKSLLQRGLGMDRKKTIAGEVVQGPTVSSLNANMSFHITNNLTFTSTEFSGEIFGVVEGKITGSATVIVKKKSSSQRFRPLNKHFSKKEQSAPSPITGQGTKRFESVKSDIDFTGAYANGDFNLYLIAENGTIKFGSPILKEEASGMKLETTLYVCGININLLFKAACESTAALFDGNKKLPKDKWLELWKELCAKEEMIGLIDACLDSSNIYELLVSGWDASVGGANLLNDIARGINQEQLLSELIRRYGKADVKIETVLKKYHTYLERTAENSGVNVANLYLLSRKMILEDGVHVHATEFMKIDCQEIIGIAAALHHRQVDWKIFFSVGVGLDWKPHFGIGYERNKVKGSRHENAKLSASVMDVPASHLKGNLIIKADRVIGKGKVDLESKVDVEKRKNLSVHVSSKADVSVYAGAGHSERLTPSNTSSFTAQNAEGLEVDASLVGATLDLPGANVKHVSGSSIIERNNYTGIGVSVNVKGLYDCLLGEKNQSKSPPTGNQADQNMPDINNQTNKDSPGEESKNRVVRESTAKQSNSKNQATSVVNEIKPEPSLFTKVQVQLDIDRYKAEQKPVVIGASISTTEGVIHTKNKNGLKVKKDHHFHRNLDIPFTNQERIAKFLENLVGASNRISNGFNAFFSNLKKQKHEVDAVNVAPSDAKKQKLEAELIKLEQKFKEFDKLLKQFQECYGIELNEENLQPFDNQFYMQGYPWWLLANNLWNEPQMGLLYQDSNLNQPLNETKKTSAGLDENLVLPDINMPKFLRWLITPIKFLQEHNNKIRAAVQLERDSFHALYKRGGVWSVLAFIGLGGSRAEPSILLPETPLQFIIFGLANYTQTSYLRNPYFNYVPRPIRPVPFRRYRTIPLQDRIGNSTRNPLRLGYSKKTPQNPTNGVLQIGYGSNSGTTNAPSNSRNAHSLLPVPVNNNLPTLTIAANPQRGMLASPNIINIHATIPTKGVPQISYVSNSLDPDLNTTDSRNANPLLPVPVNNNLPMSTSGPNSEHNVPALPYTTSAPSHSPENLQAPRTTHKTSSSSHFSRNPNTFLPVPLNKNLPIPNRVSNLPRSIINMPYAIDPTIQCEGEQVKLYEYRGLYFYTLNDESAKHSANLIKNIPDCTHPRLMPLIHSLKYDSYQSALGNNPLQVINLFLLPYRPIKFNGFVAGHSKSNIIVCLGSLRDESSYHKNVSFILHEKWHQVTVLGGFHKYLLACKSADQQQLKPYLEAHASYVKDYQKIAQVYRQGYFQNLPKEEQSALMAIINGVDRSLNFYCESYGYTVMNAPDQLLIGIRVSEGSAYIVGAINDFGYEIIEKWFPHFLSHIEKELQVLHAQVGERNYTSPRPW